MKITNTLGIWMDYSYAFLAELPDELSVSDGDLPDTLLLNCKSKLELKNKLITKGVEKDQAAYFKKISNIILNYSEVLIFGTTDAKKEFMSMLGQENAFNDIKIELRETQNMTKSQLSAFSNS
jgi:glutaredoxin-related protein